MLAFTPDVEAVLSWFQRTHEVRSIGNAMAWRQVRQPRPGGLPAQDAWLASALDYARAVSNGLLWQQRQRAAGSADDELRTFHERERQERKDRVH